ncbi:MAG: sigma-54 dependent transcriptional regulator [Terriglobales bacterium]
MNSVLVVDDEPGMRMALQASFQRVGWRVETASGSSEALRKFTASAFPLVVTDVRMPDGDGLNLMRQVRHSRPSTAVILLTAFGSVPEAVKAIQGGACDYLTKPVSFEQLQSTVTRVMRQAARPTDGRTRPTRQADAIVGNSSALRQVLDRARHAARTNADVLIEAESGTGKELLARFIHDASSRSGKPFIAINCAAVPENLLESELFGHVRGAFTGAAATKTGKFELAQGGTLLLDEIGEMPVNLQPKLLRALQERAFERLGDTRTIEVDIRVIATTNISLYSMVEQGRFRADLYYRLNVIPLSLPALRNRREDIPVLAESFACEFAQEQGRALPILSADFIASLQRQPWPGNIRELRNFIRRVLTLSDASEIGPEFVTSEAFSSLRSEISHHTATTGGTPGTSMRAVERHLLENALGMTGGNRTRAAEMLGVSVRTIRNKIRQYGLPPRSNA